MSSNPYDSRTASGKRVPKTFGPSKAMSLEPKEMSQSLLVEEKPITYVNCRIIGAVRMESGNGGIYYCEGSDSRRVGKSSLVNRLTGKEFDLYQRRNTYKCNGGNDDARHISTGSMVPYYVDGAKYRVRFFEHLDAGDSFLYGQYGTNVIILMYDITSSTSLKHLRKQVEEIQEWNTDCQSNMPIVILGNKSDCKHLREIPYDEGKEFATEIGAYAFYEVSVLKNTIENSKKSLSEVLSEDIVQCHLNNSRFKEETLERLQKAKRALDMIQIVTNKIETYRDKLDTEIQSEDLVVFNLERKKEKRQLFFNLKTNLMILEKDPNITPEAVRDSIISYRQINRDTALESGFFSKRATALLNECVAETQKSIKI